MPGPSNVSGAPRGARFLVIAATFSLVLLACLTALYLVVPKPSEVATQASAVGGPFTLVGPGGTTVTERDFKGKPYLMFFGFTHCPDVCPTALFEISEVMRALGRDADRTAAIFVSVDPERDTPAVMADYLSSFDPHLRGLTGSDTQVQAVTKAFRVYYKKVPLPGGDYTMDHSAMVYLMDKDGRFVAPFNLKRTPDAAAADLRKYL